MPKDTFFKLPEGKRKVICEVAIDEFAIYPFDQASINRIVANAGIAKGSFYQYFEDKKDLFFYIMDLITEEKISTFSPVLLNPEDHDLFTIIKELFLSGIQFANKHPRYAAIGDKLLQNKDTAVYAELKDSSKPRTQAIFEPLIAEAIRKGDLRSDIDPKIIRKMLRTINIAIVEYWSEDRSLTSDESAIAVVDAFIDLLKNGISEGQAAAV